MVDPPHIIDFNWGYLLAVFLMDTIAMYPEVKYMMVKKVVTFPQETWPTKKNKKWTLFWNDQIWDPGHHNNFGPDLGNIQNIYLDI